MNLICKEESTCMNRTCVHRVAHTHVGNRDCSMKECWAESNGKWGMRPKPPCVPAMVRCVTCQEKDCPHITPHLRHKTCDPGPCSKINGEVCCE